MSGRDLADIRDRVGLPGIWYAGSHGFELIGRLRSDGRMADLPIIAVSGDPDPSIPARARKLGANAFFAKPFSPSAVRDALVRLIGPR